MAARAYVILSALTHQPLVALRFASPQKAKAHAEQIGLTSYVVREAR
jgi:hypothetical protein